VIFIVLSALLILVAVAVAVVRLFVRWEREGKEQLAPLILLALLVIEGTIYANSDVIPRGLFHPGSGGAQVRLPEIYITLALIARWIARGAPKRIGLAAGLWLTFGVWLLVGIVVGKINHNPFSQIIYEGKDILYVVGAYALAAGVPVRKYLDRGDLFKLGTLCVICASLVDLMYVGHVDINTNLPLLPLQNFGAAVGNETAGLFFAIAGTCYLVRLTTGPARLLDFLALVPVVVAVVLANERAALANVAVATLVVLLAVAIGHWRHHPRRFNVRSGQVVMVALLAVAIAIMVVVVPAAADRHPAKIPLASTYQNLFHSKGKTESAQDRFNLASEVEELIPHHLLIGYGLGVEFQYYEAGFQQLQETAYAHDILLDLWLRLGLIGVLLFTIAFVASIVGGLRAWRRHPDARIAALALGLVAVVAGLLVVAFLEPMLDEYRYATLFGISLGILRSCVTSLDSVTPLTRWRQDPVPAVLPGRRRVWTS
jgi:O-antigen ligase